MKNHSIILITLVGLLAAMNPTSGQESAKQAAPLKVLLVAGGCCHDYATQTQLLKNGIEKRINAVVTIVYNPDTKTNATFKIYESDDWAQGYDVVVHDECTSAVTDKPYVNRILDAHKNGLPAVNLHCAMHSYRSGNFREPVEPGADNALWYEMLGVQSTAHGPKVPIDISFADQDHAITKGMEDWTTIDEELYNNVRVFAGTTVLASGKQFIEPNKKELKNNPDAKPRDVSAVVAWTNEYGPKKTKIFSTSLGHHNGTVGDDRYLELVTRGLLWATGNLTADGKPTPALQTVSSDQPQGIDALAGPDSPLAKGEVIAFFGDSITQGGAAPGGYCRLIGDAIEKQRPELGVKIVYAGISGHKVPDLQGRLDRDVLSKNPTMVFIYIGINDVWHSTRGRGTPKDRFDAGLRDLIDKITDAGAKVVLCTPSTIGEKTDGSNALDPMLEEYSAVSRKVAADTGVTLCDLRREFLDHLKEHNPDNKERGILTGDGVHLNAAGNQFVAAQAAEAIAKSLKEANAKKKVSP